MKRFLHRCLISGRKKPPRFPGARPNWKLPWLLLKVGEKYEKLVDNLIFKGHLRPLVGTFRHVLWGNLIEVWRIACEFEVRNNVKH
jgi:hypothetical protein